MFSPTISIVINAHMCVVTFTHICTQLLFYFAVYRPHAWFWESTHKQINNMEQKEHTTKWQRNKSQAKKSYNENKLAKMKQKSKLKRAQNEKMCLNVKVLFFDSNVLWFPSIDTILCATTILLLYHCRSSILVWIICVCGYEGMVDDKL